VSRKSHKIAALILSHQGGEWDAHYLGYFQCFNQQLFFEAHEVLEELWLAQRGQPNDLFYKGLIQLAGAFVHIQKKRPGPALALFHLARANLARYPATHQGLRQGEVLGLIGRWIAGLESPSTQGAFLSFIDWPRLCPKPGHPAENDRAHAS
jgi:predicted metal-dependent hydrolase